MLFSLCSPPQMARTLHLLKYAILMFTHASLRCRVPAFMSPNAYASAKVQLINYCWTGGLGSKEKPKQIIKQ